MISLVNHFLFAFLPRMFEVIHFLSSMNLLKIAMIRLWNSVFLVNFSMIHFHSSVTPFHSSMIPFHSSTIPFHSSMIRSPISIPHRSFATTDYPFSNSHSLASVYHRKAS